MGEVNRFSYFSRIFFIVEWKKLDVFKPALVAVVLKTQRAASGEILQGARLAVKFELVLAGFNILVQIGFQDFLSVANKKKWFTVFRCRDIRR